MQLQCIEAAMALSLRFTPNSQVWNNIGLVCNLWLDIFFDRWFPEVQNIFYQGNKRKQVPSNQNQEKLEAFFNCAATLMTEQLQSLALDSIQDFSDLLVQPAVNIWSLNYMFYDKRSIY